MGSLELLIEQINQKQQKPKQVFFFETGNGIPNRLETLFTKCEQYETGFPDKKAGRNDYSNMKFINTKKIFIIFVTSHSVTKNEICESDTLLNMSLQNTQLFELSPELQSKGDFIIHAHVVCNKSLFGEANSSGEIMLVITALGKLFLIDVSSMEVKGELTNFLKKLCSVNLEIYQLVNVKKSAFNQIKDICFVFQRQSLTLSKKHTFLFTKTFSEYDFEVCCSMILKSNKGRIADVVKTKYTDLQAPFKISYEDSCFIESFQLDQDYFVYLTSDPQKSIYKFHSLSTLNIRAEDSWKFHSSTPIGSKNFAQGTYKHEPLIVFVSNKLLALYTVISPDEQLWYLKNAVIDITKLDSLGIDKILKIELPRGDTPNKIYVYGETVMVLLHLEYDHTVFAKTKIRSVQKFDLPMKFLMIGDNYSITSNHDIVFFANVDEFHKLKIDQTSFFDDRILEAVFEKKLYSTSGVSLDPWDKHNFVPFHHTNYEHLEISGLTTSSFEFESNGIDANSVKLEDCYWSPGFDSLIMKATTDGIIFSNFCQIPHTNVSSGHQLLYTKYCKTITSYETSHKSSEILASANYFLNFENAELIIYLTSDGMLHLVKMSCESSIVSQTYPPLKIISEKMVTKASIIGDKFQVTISNFSQSSNLILIACQQGVIGVENYQEFFNFNWPKELESLTICDFRSDNNSVANVTTSSGHIFELEVSTQNSLLKVQRKKHLSTEFQENSIVLDYHNTPSFYLSNNTLYDIKSLKPLQLPYVSVWFCHQHFHKATDKWLIYTKDNKRLEFTYDFELAKERSKVGFSQKVEAQPREFYVKEILLNSLNFRFSLVAVYSLTKSRNQKRFVKLVIFDLLTNATLKEYSAASLNISDTADIVSLRPLVNADDAPPKVTLKHLKKTGIDDKAYRESSALSVQLEQVFNKCFVVCLNYRDSGKRLKNELLIYHFNEHELVEVKEQAIKLQHRFTLLTGSRIAFCDRISKTELPSHLTEFPLFMTITEDGSLAQTWNVRYHPAEHRFEVVSQSEKHENTFAFAGSEEDTFVASKKFDHFTVLPCPFDAKAKSVYIGMTDTKSGRFQLLRYEYGHSLQWLTKTEQLVCLDKFTVGQHVSMNTNKIIYASECTVIMLVNGKKDIIVANYSSGMEANLSLASHKKRKLNPASLQKHCVFDFCDLSPFGNSQYTASAEESFRLTNSYGHFTSVDVIGKEAHGLGSAVLYLLLSVSHTRTYRLKIKC